MGKKMNNISLCKHVIKKKKQKKTCKRSLYSAFEKGSKRESLSNKLARYHRGIRRSIQRVRYGYDEVATWEVTTWFLNVVPNIIHELRVNTHGYPSSMEGATDAEKSASWNKILRRMELLFREANEETCRKKNSYQDEYDAAYEAFTKEYGAFGEKLRTKADIAMEKKGHWHRMYSMSDVKGYYADIAEKYYEEEKTIDEYRSECLKKGLKLFSKHFQDLWD